jgi:hypothetical protein
VSQIDAISCLVATLERRGYGPRKAGADGWKSRCPGHDGEGPSLSISQSEDGKVLLYCHARKCANSFILEALGLDQSALFPPDSHPTKLHGNAQTAQRKARKSFSTPEAAFASFRFGAPSATWIYHDGAGDEVMCVARFDQDQATKEFRPLHLTDAGWSIGDPDGLLPLYRLPELGPAQRVFVGEGEKASDAIRAVGLIATTSAHGSKSANKTDWRPLAGKEVVILPDNDLAGENYAADVTAKLHALQPPASVRIVHLPLNNLGDDAVEWLDEVVPQNWTMDQRRAELERLADEAPPKSRVSENDDARTRNGASPTARSEPDKAETHAETLIRLASVAELIRTDDGKAFVRVPVADHHEVHEIASRGFRNWLTRAFYIEQGKPPSSEAFQGTLKTLEARAQFDDDAISAPVFVRVAPSADGCSIDLGDSSWRTVEIIPGRWTVTTPRSVLFRRPDGLKALPQPERGGKPEELLEFLNIEPDDLPLVFAWLTAALLPRGPYPVLELGGEQGSAKSTTARVLRALVDPHKSPLRGEPKEERDLMISATNGWVLAFDNLSWIPDWLSDALCRLSTGGGFTTRQLYTDSGEVFLDAQRPVILTGIEDVVRRNDLIDRTILLFLPPISGTNRRTEAEFWNEFEAKRARLFGMLLTATADGLQKLPEIQLDALPRMADFARWGEAVCQTAGFPPRAFLAQYQSNCEAATEGVLEDSPIATALQGLLRSSNGSWYGTATALLSELNRQPPEDARRGKGRWPANARALSGHLRRLAPALRRAKVFVTFDRAIARMIRVETESTAGKTTPSPGVVPIPSTGTRAFGSPGSWEVPQPTSDDANDGRDAKKPPLTGEPTRRRLVI